MADVTQGTPSKNPINKKSASANAPSGVDIRNPDALQEQMLGFWSWIEKNSHVVVIALELAVVGALGTSVWNWWTARMEKKVQESFYTVEAKYTKIKEGFDRAKFKAMMPAMVQKDDKTNDPAATGDLAKDYGSIPGDLEKIAREHAGTAAGAQAAILGADLYLAHQQADKAIELAQIPAKSMGDKYMLANLAKILWGSALANKGNCSEAVQIWKQVIDNGAMTFLHADASLRSGLCYEALNDTAKAREMYQKVTAQGDDSTAAATAKGLLRALDMKAQPQAGPKKS